MRHLSLATFSSACIVLALTCFCCCCGVLGMPADEPSAGEYGEYFQGDIMEPFSGAFAGLIDPINHWPNAEVLYEFDSSLTASVRAKTLQAMHRVTKETDGCARFREWKPADGEAHVLIKSGNGCSATLGYSANRVTSMRLSEKCSLGSIMHELQHVLGVEHQQNRPDRDSYVKILFDNVKSGNELDFMKENSRYYDSFGQPYDFGSQMHYALTAFSKNGLPTIEAVSSLPKGVQVGQRERMSRSDVALVRAMYKCNKTS